jgi:hypothetical protein
MHCFQKGTFATHDALRTREEPFFRAAGARALAAARKRGKKLGGNRGVKPTTKVRAKATEAVEARGTARAIDIAPNCKASGRRRLRRRGLSQRA